MVSNSTESRYGKYTDASLVKPLSACKEVMVVIPEMKTGNYKT
jgi:hypothetical protein